jgi:hypothetical protein
VTRRRFLTPPALNTSGVLPTRRAGGARRETTERVHFQQPEREFDGWALNSSRGGLRAIVEDQVELGEQFQVTLGDAPKARPARIVWIQDEPDGAIVGVSYLDDAGAGAAPPPPSEPPASSKK